VHRNRLRRVVRRGLRWPPCAGSNRDARNRCADHPRARRAAAHRAQAGVGARAERRGPRHQDRRPVALSAQGYRGVDRRPGPAVFAGQAGGTMSSMEAR
jgi:hypothetical protein